MFSIGTSTLGDSYSAFIVEMANLGFIVDNPLNAREMSLESAEVILNAARHVVGADRDTIAVYPGFPRQVKEIPAAVRLCEQILHYVSEGTLLPNYPRVIREGLTIEDMVRSSKKITLAYSRFIPYTTH